MSLTSPSERPGIAPALGQVDPQRRTSEDWQQFLERETTSGSGLVATLDVPAPLLDQAVANARPMTADEYDAWPDEVFDTDPGLPSVRPDWHI